MGTLNELICFPKFSSRSRPVGIPSVTWIFTGEGSEAPVIEKEENMCQKARRPLPGCWCFICSSKQAELHLCPFISFEYLCPGNPASSVPTSSPTLSQAAKMIVTRNISSPSLSACLHWYAPSCSYVLDAYYCNNTATKQNIPKLSLQ